jgi:hypothetical protein
MAQCEVRSRATGIALNHVTIAILDHILRVVLVVPVELALAISGVHVSEVQQSSLAVCGMAESLRDISTMKVSTVASGAEAVIRLQSKQ